jgi:apolipoprotein D and lipocalin family protein
MIMRTPITLMVVVLPLYACSNHAPMATVDYVDIDRFMGDWYVVANIPTFLEKEAHNAVETYEKNEDGTIATTFTFRDGGFDGERKTYHPKGFIKDANTNALWGMQFIWPIKADYRIVYLDNDYSKTVIGREARDYVWVMARKPELSDEEYQEIVQYVGSIGYDVSKLNRVPQRWPEQPANESGVKESS